MSVSRAPSDDVEKGVVELAVFNEKEHYFLDLSHNVHNLEVLAVVGLINKVEVINSLLTKALLLDNVVGLLVHSFLIASNQPSHYSSIILILLNFNWVSSLLEEVV